eukprot:m.12458 g.12458  ORF g.12458 m.12458 type:complete len:260 (+) comp9953_c0_seq1:173-952(+)
MDDELARLSAQEKLFGLFEACFENKPSLEESEVEPKTVLREALEAQSSRPSSPPSPLPDTPLHTVLALAAKVAQVEAGKVNFGSLSAASKPDNEALLPVPTRLKDVNRLRKYNPLDAGLINSDGNTGHDCVLCDKHFSRIEGIREHWSSHRRQQPLICSHWSCTYVSQNYAELRYHEKTCTAQDEALANGLPATKKAKSTRATRSRHTIGEDTHCNCMWTAEAKQGQPCCVTDDCPCVQKGVACIGCACMRCQNKTRSA